MIQILCTDISTADEAVYRNLYAQASPERQLRADRYRRWEDKLRCVIADALLRTALGSSNYTLKKNTFGKPRIQENSTFHYNISHSGRYVVIAFGDTEVGVDVEQIREDVDIEALAGRFFTRDEQQYILEAPDQKRDRFFTVWTGKESYLKYLGTGLGKATGSFSILTPEPGIRYRHRTLTGGYSLTLCTTDPEDRLTMLDVQQLVKL